MNKKLIAATKEYFSREVRKSHPEGEFDNAKRWHPSDAEERDCCSSIRSPTRSWPNSLNKHCRSVEHIANLYEVDTSALRKICLRVKRIAKDMKASLIDEAIKCIEVELMSEDIVLDKVVLPVAKGGEAMKQRPRRI